MIDINSLEETCPKCNGLGRIRNPIWTKLSEKKFRQTSFLERANLEDIFENKPIETMSLLCKKCRGKGKVLTTEGLKLIKFMKDWQNPNY